MRRVLASSPARRTSRATGTSPGALVSGALVSGAFVSGALVCGAASAPHNSTQISPAALVARQAIWANMLINQEPPVNQEPPDACAISFPLKDRRLTGC